MSTKPTCHAYVVSEAKEGHKARWTRIGAIWPHSKGNGFDLVIPEGIAVSGRVVCLPPKPDETE